MLLSVKGSVLGIGFLILLAMGIFFFIPLCNLFFLYPYLNSLCIFFGFLGVLIQIYQLKSIKEATTWLKKEKFFKKVSSQKYLPKVFRKFDSQFFSSSKPSTNHLGFLLYSLLLKRAKTIKYIIFLILALTIFGCFRELYFILNLLEDFFLNNGLSKGVSLSKILDQESLQQSKNFFSVFFFSLLSLSALTSVEYFLQIEEEHFMAFFDHWLYESEKINSNKKEKNFSNLMLKKTNAIDQSSLQADIGQYLSTVLHYLDSLSKKIQRNTTLILQINQEYGLLRKELESKKEKMFKHKEGFDDNSKAYLKSIEHSTRQLLSSRELDRELRQELRSLIRKLNAKNSNFYPNSKAKNFD